LITFPFWQPFLSIYSCLLPLVQRVSEEGNKRGFSHWPGGQ
jgi:hypothetical protein